MKRFMWVFLLMSASLQGAVSDSSDVITIKNDTDNTYHLSIFVAGQVWAPLNITKEFVKGQSVSADGYKQYTVGLRRGGELVSKTVSPGSYSFDGKDILLDK